MSVDELSVPAASALRSSTVVVPPDDTYQPPSFLIAAANKSYKHQYANLYFIRLRLLRTYVEERAQRRWGSVSGAPKLIPRVLDVVKSRLCYIVGTVYMEMPLKPNVLEDIGRDHSLPVPPPRDKFFSEQDSIMLEDESGRIPMIGKCIETAGLVTGVILGALGVETANGEFEVVDICYAGLAPRDEEVDEDDEMDVDTDPSTTSEDDEHIAIISGLDIGSPSPPDAQLQMLVEYLAGEAGIPSSIHITRLIIAGNSLALSGAAGNVGDTKEPIVKKPRRYGYDAASFDPKPGNQLTEHLLDIGSSLPIHILPGQTDPSGTILPQQPLPRAMLGPVSRFASFNTETNPTYIRLSTATSPTDQGTTAAGPCVQRKRKPCSRTFLVHSGQPLDDMFKYLPTPPYSRLGLAESTLRWRHMAPTAPDTLWCHPYFSSDPFIIAQTPDVYVIGNQPKFGTKLVLDEGGDGIDGGPGRPVRIVLVPSFSKTGVLVLVNMRTLDVKTVCFSVEGMTGEVGGESS